jgi:hypoxanthine phosphoribosyltransferase
MKTAYSFKPLFSTEEIQTRVASLGREIARDYKGKDLLAIGVLNGAFVFFSDLIRCVELPAAIDFIAACSYRGNETSGQVEIHSDLREPVQGRDVLIVEDIIDTGITIDYIVNLIRNKNPKSIQVCALLDKKARRRVEVPLDYVGFEVPDVFVVGYGMDYENRFRHMPYIAEMDEKI